MLEPVNLLSFSRTSYSEIFENNDPEFNYYISRLTLSNGKDLYIFTDQIEDGGCCIYDTKYFEYIDELKEELNRIAYSENKYALTLERNYGYDDGFPDYTPISLKSCRYAYDVNVSQDSNELNVNVKYNTFKTNSFLGDIYILFIKTTSKTNHFYNVSNEFDDKTFKFCFLNKKDLEKFMNYSFETMLRLFVRMGVENECR